MLLKDLIDTLENTLIKVYSSSGWLLEQRLICDKYEKSSKYSNYEVENIFVKDDILRIYLKRVTL